MYQNMPACPSINPSYNIHYKSTIVYLCNHHAVMLTKCLSFNDNRYTN